MLVQQAVATTVKVGLPALFPAIAGELAFDPKYVLIYTWFFAAVAVVVMAGCGGVIRRYGALRTSQTKAVNARTDPINTRYSHASSDAFVQLAGSKPAHSPRIVPSAISNRPPSSIS